MNIISEEKAKGKICPELSSKTSIVRCTPKLCMAWTTYGYKKEVDGEDEKVDNASPEGYCSRC